MSEHDTALVFFANQNAFTSGLPICERQPVNGAQVTLVGFGCTDLTNCPGSNGANSKRMGTNTLQVGATLLQFTGPAQDGDGATATAVSGDSGSPYIVTQNGSNCVAGVHSRRPPELMVDNPPAGPSPGDRQTGIGANLHNTSSRTFLTTQLPGIDCDIYETQQNCTQQFTRLHQFLYRQQPTTAILQTYVPRLTGNLTTLWRITTEVRQFRSSLMQPAWAMFLEEP